MHNKLVDLIKKDHPNVKLIYLFGSQASGQQHGNSDWDLAILNDTKLDPLNRWQLSEKLAELLKTDVDLVDLKEASTVLQMQIVTKGSLLFDKNNDSAAFEMMVFSMYGRLQEGRKSIITNFINEAKNA
ncbi:MAG: nucleotidyltransferase domain-containing protein [Alteromonadaceae bacterium]|nr:nucleotidyltransferase domain-containing protein [Alteromonadaceae bacterium]